MSSKQIQINAPVDTFHTIPKIIDGSVAGVIGASAIFPIDLVKTRLQTQNVAADGKPMYNGIFDCTKKTFQREGFFGCYRGLAVRLVFIVPDKTIKLVGNDFYRHHLRDPRTKKLTMPREMFAGALAGLGQTLVSTPMEQLKIQLQNAGCSGNLPGSAKLTATSIAIRLLRERGIFGLYRGYRATVLRDVSFAVILFPLFANLHALGKRKPGSNDVHLYHSFICGLTAGSISAFLTTPFDVIKTRLQSQNVREKKYKGIIDCFVKTFRFDGGTKALFKGGMCRVLVIAPLWGIAQAVYYFGVGKYVVDKAVNFSLNNMD